MGVSRSSSAPVSSPQPSTVSQSWTIYGATCDSERSIGSLGTRIAQLSGLSIANTRNTEPPIANEHTRKAATTVPFCGAFSPKLANINAIQDTRIASAAGLTL